MVVIILHQITKLFDPTNPYSNFIQCSERRNQFQGKDFNFNHFLFKFCNLMEKTDTQSSPKLKSIVKAKG